MAADISDLSKKYPFLHSHVAKEAYVYEVLEEISRYQAQVLRTGSGKMATFDTLKDSRNIKMPFTHVRGKNIAYILENLAKSYPEELRRIFSFSFIADQETKKLSINEDTEYTVLINSNDLRKVQEERDRDSVENLHGLLQNFRLFNLTKLLKKSKNREHLAKLVKNELGKNIFTFKHHTLDRNNLEASEDFCFHKNNYDAVKKSLQIDNIKKIVMANSTQIARRLQKFGIVNTDFSDYRDSKVDYLLNIILEDISNTLGQKDLVEVKNFHSLRSCLMKVDKLVDPLIMIGNDIAAHIKESGITKRHDVLATFNTLTDEMLDAWLQESMDKHRIIVYRDEGDDFLIDGGSFLGRISEYHTKILYQQEDFAKLSQYEKQGMLDAFGMLCDTGKALLLSEEKTKLILQTGENAEKLKKILKEYDDFKKRLAVQEDMSRESQSKKTKKSFFAAIADFFKSLFTGRKKEGKSAKRETAASQAIKYTLTKDMQTILQKISDSKSPVIPLSNYIKVTEDNNFEIDAIIDELRNKNIKTVIPIYSARKALYPARSKKYIIPDIEYLMINPDIVLTSDSIRSFTDSLAGQKIREEVFPPAGILAIEKYLLILYRQKKAQMKRKD